MATFMTRIVPNLVMTETTMGIRGPTRILLEGIARPLRKRLPAVHKRSLLTRRHHPNSIALRSSIRIPTIKIAAIVKVRVVGERRGIPGQHFGRMMWMIC